MADSLSYFRRKIQGLFFPELEGKLSSLTKHLQQEH